MSWFTALLSWKTFKSQVKQVCWWHQAEGCSWHARRTRCHPEGPGQAGEVGLCKPHEVQIDQEQSPAPGSGQPLISIKAGRLSDWKQLCHEELGGTDGRKAGQEPTVSLPLCSLWWDMESLWGLEFLEPSAQERHGPVGAGPEEGHQNDPRAGAPLLHAQAERVGVVQPGEEKIPGRPYWGFSPLKGDL